MKNLLTSILVLFSLSGMQIAWGAESDLPNALVVWQAPFFPVANLPVFIAPEALDLPRNVGLNDVTGVSKQIFEAFKKPLTETLPGVLIGKSVEVFVCERFPDDLSKETCKALGKLVKTAQNPASDLQDIISAPIASFGATWVANKLLGHSLALPLVLAGFVLEEGVVQLSHPSVLRNLTGLITSGTHQAVDDWVLRPILLKGTKTGWRYAAEKLLQQNFLNPLMPMIEKGILVLAPSYPGVAEPIARGYIIGISKLMIGTVSQIIISGSQIYVSMESGQTTYNNIPAIATKLLRDVSARDFNNVVVSAALPIALSVVGKRRVILGFMVFYGALAVYYVGSSYL
jgi:hypothetical protein